MRYEDIEKLGVIIHVDEFGGEETAILGAVDGYEPGVPSTLYDMGERECFSEVTAWELRDGDYVQVFNMDLLDEIEKRALEHYA